MGEITKEQEALNKYFEDSENVTAQHVLYKNFVDQYGMIVNKFMMYVLFDTAWGNCTGKAEDGSAGYHKRVKLKEANNG